MKNPIYIALLALEAFGWHVDYRRLVATCVTTEGLKHVLIEAECTILPETGTISFSFSVHVRYPFNDASRALLARLKAQLAHRDVELAWDDTATFVLFQDVPVPHVFEAWSSEAFLEEISSQYDAVSRLVFSCIHSLNACERITVRNDRFARARIAPEYLSPFCLLDVPEGVYHA